MTTYVIVDTSEKGEVTGEVTTKAVQAAAWLIVWNYLNIPYRVSKI